MRMLGRFWDEPAGKGRIAKVQFGRWHPSSPGVFPDVLALQSWDRNI
jgi:hypothetical protein